MDDRFRGFMTEGDFQKKVIDVVGVNSYNAITTNTRKNKIVYLRMIFAKFYRSSGMPLKKIGQKINKNHSTIVHYLKKFDIECEYNKDFSNLVNKILKE